MEFKIKVLIVLLVLCDVTLGKRSRGRSRGSSGTSGTSVWNRKAAPSAQPVYPKQEYVAKSIPPSQTAAKPSAPASDHFIKKEQQSNIQSQSSPINNNNNNNNGQIGWNVPPGNNQAVKTQQGQSYQAAPQGPPAYNPGAAPPPYSQGGYQGGFQQPSPAYNPYGHQNHAPPPYSPYGAPQQGAPAYNPHNPYPGYYPTSNIGVVPPRGADHGHYYSSQSGMNQNPNPMFYNNNQYNNMQKPGGGGMFGGLFGGGRNNYGGGGYGGMNPYGGGYGMQKSSGGFFGRHAFRNVLGGLAIWYVISGLTKKPYNVYNYYNKPENGEISLPANVLTLCNENSTHLCAPSTTAICTTNNTILCVTTMNAVTPCPQEQAMCVNSTIDCVGKTDPLCQNNTSQNFTNVNLPCFANLTVDVNLMDYAANNTNGTVSLTGNKDFTYCVTTYAVPGPEANCTETPDSPLCKNDTLEEAPGNVTEVQTGGGMAPQNYGVPYYGYGMGYGYGAVNQPPPPQVNLTEAQANNETVQSSTVEPSTS